MIYSSRTAYPIFITLGIEHPDSKESTELKYNCLSVEKYESKTRIQSWVNFDVVRIHNQLYCASCAVRRGSGLFALCLQSSEDIEDLMITFKEEVGKNTIAGSGTLDLVTDEMTGYNDGILTGVILDSESGYAYFVFREYETKKLHLYRKSAIIPLCYLEKYNVPLMIGNMGKDRFSVADYEYTRLLRTMSIYTPNFVRKQEIKIVKYYIADKDYKITYKELV